jgi:hypothetical protein
MQMRNMVWFSVNRDIQVRGCSVDSYVQVVDFVVLLCFVGELRFRVDVVEVIKYCVYVSKLRVKNQEDVIDIAEVVHKFVFVGHVGKVCVFDVLKKDFWNDTGGRGAHCKAICLNNRFVIEREVVLFHNDIVPVYNF